MNKKWRASVYAIVITVFATGCAKSGNGAGSTSPALGTQNAAGVETPAVSSSSASSTAGSASTGTGSVLAVATVPAGRSSSAANLRVCAGSSSVAGTDVSNYDPNTNWTTFKQAGRAFAFVKATEGTTFVNDLFASDWANLKKQGVARGAYHFFHPGDDPVKQATEYLKIIGTLASNDLGPMLDWEVSDNVKPATQIANAKTWLALVEGATGKTPIIYVDPSFFNSLGNPQGFQKYPLFIANYGASCPSIPPPWSNWTFWQKAIGTVPGVETSQADVDSYNGTLAQLASFTKN